MLAGGDVELPAMPRTGQNAAIEPAFAERAALMRADAIERVKLALDRVEHGNDAVFRDQFAGRADRTFVKRRESNPTGHGQQWAAAREAQGSAATCGSAGTGRGR